MSRREQLAHALKDARKQHAATGSRGTFDRMKAAANTLKQWIERFDALTEERRKAAMLFREDEVARIDKLITKLCTPDGEITDVKLVDAAGTLRLDLNGRRTFMNREQALGLFLKLGGALEDGTFEVGQGSRLDFKGMVHIATGMAAIALEQRQ